jgi:hypothetical protein
LASENNTEQGKKKKEQRRSGKEFTKRTLLFSPEKKGQ